MEHPELETVIAGIRLKNPVVVASGTFGYGLELRDKMDVGKLGGIITKSITLEEREGNAPPRTAETPGGMLNSIGLQNIGVKRLIDEKLPLLGELNIPIIVNVAGSTMDEYAAVCEMLEGQKGICGIELNVSCPNVNRGGMEFGKDARQTEALVRMVRKATKLPILAKLTPNVTDIGKIARGAEEGGADGISAINTILGMAIDARMGKAKLSTCFGGLSGPAIKPVALRCVWQIAQATKLPIMGIGGINCGEDAIEFIMAGSSAVGIGTANLIEIGAARRICNEIYEFMSKEGWRNIKEMVGVAQRN